MMFWRRRRPVPQTELLAVVPPRSTERTLLGIENLLQSLAIEEPFSLELVGTADRIAFLVRTRSPSLFRQQLAIHYPQARIQGVAAADDPLLVKAGERAWTRVLTLAGPEYLPLRTFKDDDLLDTGSDPLLAVLGALGALGGRERLVSRLLLRALGPEWSQAYQRREFVATGSSGSGGAYQAQTRPLQADAVGLMLLIGLLGLGLQNYLWLRDDRVILAALLDAGVVLGGALAAPVVWKRLLRPPKAYDGRLVQEKISRPAFRAELQLTAILPEGGDAPAAEKLLRPLSTAFHHYDLATGNRFRDGKLITSTPADPLIMAARKPRHGRSVLNTREVATLWHPPRGGDEVPLLERAGARSIYPLARGVRNGALVGTASNGNNEHNVRFTEDLLRQHQLYVAKTRMGKSTLMQHVVAHKLAAKARDQDPDAIVVIDPHSDLVRSLLTLVPRGLAEHVYLVDLADPDRVPGINLLDTDLFPDRDRATDNVIQVVKNLWEQWGPRMQSILEHTLKSLYEANRHPDMARDRQYTILDGLHLLADQSFRRQVLVKVQDPYLIRWWARDFSDWHRQYRADAIAPVQTRLAYYASSERARAILGQSASTLDLRQLIAEGNVLLVSTAQGQVGREVSALVGGTLLNVIDGVIRAQEALPEDERRRVLVVVDELQAIPGADYEAMLSELGKFGASFVMATQSLARLEELSRTLRETIFSNIGCLVAFQVSAVDARYLTWELDHDQVTEADLTSLPAYNCYVRANVGGEKLPTFSMALRPPDKGDPGAADAVRLLAARYTRPRAEVATRLEREIELHVAAYRADLAKPPDTHKKPGQKPAPPRPDDRENTQVENAGTGTQPGAHGNGRQGRGRFGQNKNDHTAGLAGAQPPNESQKE